MSEYDPGPHAEHTVAPTAENVPGEHDEHAVEVAFAANLPASQTSHWTAAEVLEYVPATHSEHFEEDPKWCTLTLLLPDTCEKDDQGRRCRNVYNWMPSLRTRNPVASTLMCHVASACPE